MTPERFAELRAHAEWATAGSEAQPGRDLHEALDEIERLQHAEAILRKIMGPDYWGNDGRWRTRRSRDRWWLGNSDFTWTLTDDEAAFLRSLMEGGA